MDESTMNSLVDDIDAILLKYPDEAAHNLAGILLSRVTLLMTMDPRTGKELVRYVWEKLDEIEQANPSEYL